MKKIFIFMYFSSFISLSFAGCILPITDVGGGGASSPNYLGYLKETGKDFILVEGYHDKSVVRIGVSELNHAYSAFGGDEIFDKLKSGIAVRVWYKRCKPSKKPEAAYVEYFSNNHLDQPSADYFNGR